MKKNLKPLCIYHADCADGFGAAWSLKEALGEENVDFYKGKYPGNPPDPTDRSIVYFLDFAYPTEMMREFVESADKVIVLDHHKTAYLNLKEFIDNGEIEAVLDMDRSAAMITWDYFFPDKEPPELFWYIQDFDLRRELLPHCEEVMASVFSYDYYFSVWDDLVKIEIPNMIIDGAAMIRSTNNDIQEFIDIAAHTINIQGYVVPIINVPFFWATKACEMMIEQSGAPFAMSYWDAKERRYFSLRSLSQKVDVSQIAEQYGGGGHPYAAGFNLPHGSYTNTNLDL